MWCLNVKINLGVNFSVVNLFSMSSSADLSNPHSLPTHSPRLGQNKWKRKRERGKVVWYRKKQFKGILGLVCLVGLFFIFNGFMLLRLQLDDETCGNKDMSVQNSPSISVSIKVHFFFLNKIICSNVLWTWRRKWSDFMDAMVWYFVVN